MKIVTCFKVVPEEQDIEVTSEGQLSFARAKAAISSYDLNAIEAGAQLAENGGHELIGLSIGNAAIHDSKLKKGALSRGLDSLFMAADEKLNQMDTHQTAVLLKKAIEKMGGADLILCGEGSSDLYAQQVGIQLGALLDMNVVNSVSKITEENGCLLVERSLEEEIEILEVPLPAVLSVTSFINLPRIPGMKNILAAGKKPSTVWSAEDIIPEVPAATISVLEVKAPEQTERLQNIIEGDADDQIQEFIEKISAVIQ